MNLLIIMTFLSLFSIDYLANNLQVIPQKFFLLPEGMAAFAMIIVIIVGISKKQIHLPIRYSVFLAWLLLSITAGLVINHVDSLVAISGVRIYLKSIPFFLLPLVYSFSDKQIRHQLILLTVLLLIQLPITVYQRFVKYAGIATGDVVGGSLGVNTSGILSILLMTAIAVFIAFLVKGRIKLWLVVPLIILLFLPTTLNETKVVLILFPFVLISPLIFAPGIINRGRKLLLLSVLGVIFLIGFFVVYDILQGDREGSLMSRMKSGNMFSYMYKKDKVGRFSDAEVGRFDAIAYAIKKIDDTGNSIFGVGIGNASPSNSIKLVGAYHKKWYWMSPDKVMLSRILWEMGYTGVVLYLAFFFMVFQDSRALSKGDDLISAFALAWLPITLIIAGSFVYFSPFVSTIFSHLYFFYSGIIVAAKYNLSKESHKHSKHYKNTDPKRFAAMINPKAS